MKSLIPVCLILLTGCGVTPHKGPVVFENPVEVTCPVKYVYVAIDPTLARVVPNELAANPRVTVGDWINYGKACEVALEQANSRLEDIGQLQGTPAH